jgi:hypothetical protein
VACTTTKINILTLVLSEKKILNKTKNHNPPPLQVKWSVPNVNYLGGAIVNMLTLDVENGVA